MVKQVKNFMDKGDDNLGDAVSKVSNKTVNRFAKSDTGKNLGSWLFMIGFLIALIAGIIAGVSATGVMAVDFNVNSLMMGILVLIGIVVGLVNITDKEAVAFLIATIAIMSGSAGFNALNALSMGPLAAFLSALVSMIAIFVAPAAVIVGLKVIWATARKA